jgi:predicted extracellular nuclease
MVDTLKSPHIIALQEMMGDGDNNTSAKENASFLIEQLHLFDPKHSYAYCDAPPKKDGEDGGIPGGNIRCGFLYRTDRVKLEGSPSRIGENDPAFTKSRKPCYAQFKDIKSDEIYHLINVHFIAHKSPARLREGENLEEENRARLARRTQQATLTADYAHSLLSQSPTDASASHVVICGDFNNIDHSTLAPFEAKGFIHASGSIDSEHHSCFWPDENGGQRGGTIDHMFLSPSLASRITDVSRSMLNNGTTKDPDPHP